MKQAIRILPVQRSRSQLALFFEVDELRFTTSYWYEGVDFHDLEERYGKAFLERIDFHIAAFEANKLASLHVREIDWGPYAHLADEAFESLWRTVFYNVWGQWRYENDLPAYRGPAFRPSAPVAQAPMTGSPVTVSPGEVEVLSFCGGGKDSLAAMKLLEGAGIPFDTLAYSASIYGSHARQHALVDGLVDHGAARARRRQWIFDDFLDSPVLDLGGTRGIRTLTAAETPSSVFASLPYALQHGYRYLALGHERSADTGQLFWEKTGEDVNHQWGKSWEAEQLLNGYLESRLIANVEYFSLLKPLYDTVIFSSLRRHPEAVPATHSCNTRKPWCRRCAKCLYVWLGYAAYLPQEVVLQTFGPENLFDVEENLFTFRQLLGLEAHLPFECIGQVDEVRLAFELCRRRGRTGRALDVYEREFGTLDLRPALARYLARYLTVDTEAAALPEAFRTALVARMESLAEDARHLIGRWLAD